MCEALRGEAGDEESGRGGRGGTARGCGVSFCGDERFPELDSSDGRTPLSVLEAVEWCASGECLWDA